MLFSNSNILLLFHRNLYHNSVPVNENQSSFPFQKSLLFKVLSGKNVHWFIDFISNWKFWHIRNQMMLSSEVGTIFNVKTGVTLKPLLYYIHQMLPVCYVSISRNRETGNISPPAPWEYKKYSNWLYIFQRREYVIQCKKFQIAFWLQHLNELVCWEQPSSWVTHGKIKL